MNTNGTVFKLEERGVMPDEERIKLISGHFRSIMDILGLDPEDESLKETPDRVARMYVKDLFSGLNERNKPGISLYQNDFGYRQMLVEKNISVYSSCEHHFVPIIGKAHVAYISSGKVIGLSKINRVVRYFCQRPQLQERLTVQIASELKRILETEHVAVLIEAKHLCVAARGIRDVDCGTITSDYHGLFLDADKRNEFIKQVLD